MIVRLKRCLANKHLIDDAPKGPKIGVATWLVVFQHLWCNIEWCTDKRSMSVKLLAVICSTHELREWASTWPVLALHLRVPFDLLFAYVLRISKVYLFEGNINKILTLQFWDRTSHLLGYSMASNLCALSAAHGASILDPAQDLPRRTLPRVWVAWSQFGPGRPQEIR